MSGDIVTGVQSNKRGHLRPQQIGAQMGIQRNRHDIGINIIFDTYTCTDRKFGQNPITIDYIEFDTVITASNSYLVTKIDDAKITAFNVASPMLMRITCRTIRIDRLLLDDFLNFVYAIDEDVSVACLNLHGLIRYLLHDTSSNHRSVLQIDDLFQILGKYPSRHTEQHDKTNQ